MFVKSAVSGSQKLLFSCFSFVSGILINSFWTESWKFFPVFLILAVFFFLFLKNSKKIIIVLALISFSFGLVRSFLFLNYDPGLLDNQALGFINQEPKQKEKTLNFILETDKGKILVITHKFADLEQCDQVEITGEIKKIEGAFFGSSAKDKVFFNSFFPETRVVERKKCSSWLVVSRNKINENLHSTFSSPQSTILGAMILGKKDQIPVSWQNKLNVAGIRHITAVSGMHVAVISIVFLNLALLFFKRKKALIFSLLGTILFVVFIGAHPSAVRAGIMGAVVIIAQIFGRMKASLRILIITASLMLVFNPLLLRYDIGFQLSFSAVSGIIVFSSFFEKIFKFLPETARKIMAASFSAHVFVFPFLAYYFKEISLIFPLTNLLILPVLYWVMLLGIIFAFLSLISGTLAYLIFVPLYLFLTYLVFIVDFFSQFPWVMVRATGTVFIVYLFLLSFLFKKKKEAEEEEFNCL
jgi:ComEC/Rec2-related protein